MRARRPAVRRANERGASNYLVHLLVIAAFTLAVKAAPQIPPSTRTGAEMTPTGLRSLQAVTVLRTAAVSSWRNHEGTNAESNFFRLDHNVRWIHSEAHNAVLAEQARRSSLADEVRNSTLDAYERGKELLEKYERFAVGSLIPLGIVSSLFGYFLLLPVLALTGLFLGGAVACVITYHATKNSSLVAWACVSSAVLAGTLSAIIAVKLVRVGVFLLGAALGLAVGYALRHGLPPSISDVYVYALTAVFSVGLGVLSLRFQRSMLVVTTSFSGSFAVVYGAAYFQGHVDALVALGDRRSLQLAWAYLAAFVVLGAITALAQSHLVRRYHYMRGLPISASRARYTQTTPKSDSDDGLPSAYEVLSKRSVSSSARQNISEFGDSTIGVPSGNFDSGDDTEDLRRSLLVDGGESGVLAQRVSSGAAGQHELMEDGFEGHGEQALLPI